LIRLWMNRRKRRDPINRSVESNDSQARAGFAYDAFASYSTRADYGFVRRFESFLESFHKLPVSGDVALHKLELCVDGSDFSIGAQRARVREAGIANSDPGVITEIEQTLSFHLEKSRYLIVFCPGRELEGIWSDFELKWFLEHRSSTEIFLVVTRGENPWDSPEKFFSPRIVEAGLHQGICYDFRAFYRTTKGDRSTFRDFDSERIRLASDLNGVSASQVEPTWLQEERRKSSRRLVISLIVAALLAILATGAVIGAWLAVIAAGTASWQREIALAEQQAAEARATEAINPANLPEAGLRACDAYVRMVELSKESPIPAWLRIALRKLEAAGFVAVRPIESTTLLQLDDKMTGSVSEVMRLADDLIPRLVRALPNTIAGTVRAAAILPEGRDIAFLSFASANTLKFWSPGQNETRDRKLPSPLVRVNGNPNIALSGNGLVVAVESGDNLVRVYSTKTGAYLHVIDPHSILPAAAFESPTSMPVRGAITESFSAVRSSGVANGNPLLAGLALNRGGDRLLLVSRGGFAVHATRSHTSIAARTH